MVIKEYLVGWGKFLLVDENFHVHYGRLTVIALLGALAAAAVIWVQYVMGMTPLSGGDLYLPLLAAAIAVAGGLLGSLRYLRGKREINPQHAPVAQSGRGIR